MRRWMQKLVNLLNGLALAGTTLFAMGYWSGDDDPWATLVLPVATATFFATRPLRFMDVLGRDNPEPIRALPWWIRVWALVGWPFVGVAFIGLGASLGGNPRVALWWSAWAATGAFMALLGGLVAETVLQRRLRKARRNASGPPRLTLQAQGVLSSPGRARSLRLT